MGRKTKRIMTRKAYEKGQIREATHDGNREFISLLACACADGTTTPPALIYKGATNALQSTWVDDLQETDEAYFTSSENGWTCNALGMAWLRKFDKDTSAKAKNRRRLLILDGHSSHINWEFINLADSLRILILILPPHTTHRLQPLDVGLFGPLAQAYSKHLDQFTNDGLGWVAMTKRMFWGVFKKAWRDSFTAKNIKSAFKKTGIWPLKAEITIQQLPDAVLTTPIPSRVIPLHIATPMTPRAIRALIKASPSRAQLSMLKRALVANNGAKVCAEFKASGLERALFYEKKRYKRAKRLNLAGEVAGLAPQFFSPQKVIAARAFQEEKEAHEEEERRVKAQRKKDAIRLREQRDQEKADRQLQRATLLQSNRDAKEAKIARKREEREEQRAQRALKNQETAAAVAHRKEEQQIRREALAAAKIATAMEKTKKPVLRVAQISVSNPLESAAKTINLQENGPRSTTRSKKTTPLPAAAADLAGANSVTTRTRSGRSIVTPRIFEA